jgi:Xaa-Pro aminopeptidase
VTSATASRATDSSDRLEKRRRVLEILDRQQQESLLLSSPAALAWYLDGARVQVNPVGDPVLAVRVARDGDHAFVFENEMERMVAEELPPDLAVRSVPWFESLESVAGAKLPESAVAQELRDARRSLLPGELARYATLGEETAVVVTDVLTAVRSEASERDLAADLSSALVAIGAEVLVVLVGGDLRHGYRHPLPTSARLGRRSMVVVCARRRGLIANLTRWLVFGSPSADELDRQRRIAQVEAEAFSATARGGSLASVVSEIERAYPRHGFDTEEWRRHHQGGPTGYVGRDPRASPNTFDQIAPNQAFAWNPSARGTKVEDTVVLAEDGIRVLTFDPRWPSMVVAGRERPTALVR